MPAKSKSQRRLFGIALAYKRGELNSEPSEEIKDLSKLPEDKLKDYAETPEKDLPNDVDEAVTQRGQVKIILHLKNDGIQIKKDYEVRGGEFVAKDMDTAKDIVDSVAGKFKSQIKDERTTKDGKVPVMIIESDEFSDIELKVIKWFRDNPNPSDDKVHAFADELGMDHEKLEAIIYKLATDHVNTHLKEDSTKASVNGMGATKMPSIDGSEGSGDIPHQLSGATAQNENRKFIPSFDQFINEEYNKQDKLPGGLADKHTPETIAKLHNVSVDQIKNQLEIGIKVELEHVDDKDLAMEIAMDHLTELPNYYDKLKTIEPKH